MTSKLKKRIGFHYSLTEIQPRTLILLKLNRFFKKCQTKSKTMKSLPTYLEHSLMILSYVDFIELHSYNFS